jgi:hypothetical protein
MATGSWQSVRNDTPWNTASSRDHVPGRCARRRTTAANARRGGPKRERGVRRKAPNSPSLDAAGKACDALQSLRRCKPGFAIHGFPARRMRRALFFTPRHMISRVGPRPQVSVGLPQALPNPSWRPWPPSRGRAQRRRRLHPSSAFEAVRDTSAGESMCIAIEYLGGRRTRVDSG